MNDDLTIVSADKVTLDLSKEGPEAVIEHLLKSMKRLDDGFSKVETSGDEGEAFQWIKSMRQYVRFCTTAEEKFSTAQALAVAYVERHWNQLPLSFRKQFNLDFYRWACADTGKSATTIDNHLRAVKTFFFDGIAPGLSVDIPRRDPNKKVVLDPNTGKPVMEAKLWNPMIPPISKLVLARSKAVNGELNAKQWAMLMDDGVTFDQLQVEMSKGGGSRGGGGIRFRLEGTGLYAVEGNQTAPIGELSFKDFYENPDSLEHRALSRMLLMLGVNLDEQLILREEAKKAIDDAYKD